MAWSYYTYTKENVSIDDMQKIINNFPSGWFYWCESKMLRDEEPIKQDWGWSTIVNIPFPVHDWEDDEYELGTVGVVIIGGTYGISSDYAGKVISDFINNELEELGYTILKVKFNYW